MTTNPIICELCHEPAFIYCRWGVDGLFNPIMHTDKAGKQSIVGVEKIASRSELYHQANLCNKHSSELWEQCKGGVNSGVMSWWNSKPKDYEI